MQQAFKKQALQYLIQKYLGSDAEEYMESLLSMTKTTPHLALSLNSHIIEGLSEDQIKRNGKYYGRNIKSVEKSYKCARLKEIVIEEIMSGWFVLVIVITIAQFVCGLFWVHSEFKSNAVAVLVFATIVALLHCTSEYWIAIKSHQQNYQTDKHLYRVVRSGELREVPQSQLVVGDIIQVDKTVAVPVSGIIISTNELHVNEGLYNRGVQKKATIQKCLSFISCKNSLELKIEQQSKTFPSPFLLRGSQLIEDSVSMIIIAVEENQILQPYKNRTQCNNWSSPVIDSWLAKIKSKILNCYNVGLICIVVVQFLVLIFKLHNVAQNDYEQIFKAVFDSLHCVMVSARLFQGKCLMDFLRREYIKLTTSLSFNSELDKMLTVGQLFVTEENICKYDQVCVKKIVKADKFEVENFSENNFEFGRVIHLAIEVLKAVKIIKEINNEEIICRNTINQKIVTILSPNNKMSLIIQSHLKMLSCGSKMESMDRNDQQNRLESSSTSKKKLPFKQNKIIPCQVFNDLQCGVKQFKGQQVTPRSLGVLINKNIDEETKTYYYQKFSLKRLEKLQYIYGETEMLQFNRTDIEKLSKCAKLISSFGLQPYLIGYDQGVYKGRFMSILVAIIGVQTKYNDQLCQKLHQLSIMGVSSSIVRFKQADSDDDQEHVEEQLEETHLELLARGWLEEQDELNNIDDILEVGGRLVCRNCTIRNCDCKVRKYQVSNVQGFLVAVSQTKYIYNLNEEGLKYLQSGFDQLDTTTVRITNRNANTLKIIEQIISSHQLVGLFEKGISSWLIYAGIFIVCLFGFNIITFNLLFTYVQLYLILLVLKLLLTSNILASIPRSNESQSCTLLNLQNNPAQSRFRKVKVIFHDASKIQILAYLSCFVSVVMLMLFKYELFLSIDKISEYLFSFQCTIGFSIYHNSHLNVLMCLKQGEIVIIHSQISTLIYFYTLLLLCGRYLLKIIPTCNILLASVLILIIGMLFVLFYLVPSAIQCYPEGLYIKQLFGCVLSVLLTVLISETANRLIKPASLNSIDEDNQLSFGQGHYYVNVLKDYIHDRNFTIVTL